MLLLHVPAVAEGDTAPTRTLLVLVGALCVLPRRQVLAAVAGTPVSPARPARPIQVVARRTGVPPPVPLVEDTLVAPALDDAMEGASTLVLAVVGDGEVSDVGAPAIAVAREPRLVVDSLLLSVTTSICLFGY